MQACLRIHFSYWINCRMTCPYLTSISTRFSTQAPISVHPLEIIYWFIVSLTLNCALNAVVNMSFQHHVSACTRLLNSKPRATILHICHSTGLLRLRNRKWQIREALSYMIGHCFWFLCTPFLNFLLQKHNPLVKLQPSIVPL